MERPSIAQRSAHRLRPDGAPRIACAVPRARCVAHELHALPRMPYQLVTCPESAHLELIDYADTPCGKLILGCSSFRPPCNVGCPRTCAALLDRRERIVARVQECELAADDERLLAVGDITSVDVLARLHTRWPGF
jgi:hypothetical protein